MSIFTIAGNENTIIAFDSKFRFALWNEGIIYGNFSPMKMKTFSSLIRCTGRQVTEMVDMKCQFVYKCYPCIIKIFPNEYESIRTIEFEHLDHFWKIRFVKTSRDDFHPNLLTKAVKLVKKLCTISENGGRGFLQFILKTKSTYRLLVSESFFDSIFRPDYNGRDEEFTAEEGNEEEEKEKSYLTHFMLSAEPHLQCEQLFVELDLKRFLKFLEKTGIPSKQDFLSEIYLTFLEAF